MKRLLPLFVALIASLALSGCSDTKKATQDDHAGETPAAKAAHAHGAEGPHGGILIELGDAFHAELVADHDTHTVTVYLLDEDQKELTSGGKGNNVVISVFQDEAFVDYELPSTSSPNVCCLTDDTLCHMFEHSKDIKIRVRASIDGQEERGKYEHEAH